MKSENLKSGVIFKNWRENSKKRVNWVMVCGSEKIFLEVKIMRNSKIS